MNTRQRLIQIWNGPLVFRGTAPKQGRFEVCFERGKGYPEGTYLRVKLADPESVELQQIGVDPRLRGQGIAESMVRVVSDEFPNRRLWFSGTNGWSRRLARKIAAGGRIPNFDPVREIQESYRAEDEAEGFYGPSPPPIPSREEFLRDWLRPPPD